ncbi:hypothetical protein V2J09_011309 [Rumex salicifolius]
MWMQVGGYNINNEASHQNHHHHHHHQLVVNLDGGRKLRPLIPRPPPPSVAAATHSCNFGLYTAGSVGVGEQGFSHKNDNLKEESNGGGGQVAQASSSRWNPTAEQLRTLEDLYRRGTRTPSTDQIQRITAQLRRFGKIEGKNVFYWFQNHKARERQKRRRDLQSLSSSCLRHPHHDDAAAAADAPVLGIEIARKEIIKGKLGFDAEQTRSRYNASPAAEEYCGVMSMQRAEKTGRRAVSDYRSSSKSTTHNNNSSSTATNHNIGSSAVACLRFQLDDQRNATWHSLAPSSSPSYPDINNHNNNPFLKYCVNSTTTADGVTFKTRRLVASDQTPHRETTTSNKGELYEDEDSATLLQLFPLRSHVNDGQQQGEEDEDGQDQSKERDVHFFEFLPPKIN